MPVKKIVDAKGLTLTAQQLKFALGLFTAVVIAFAIWWFFFHGQYERIAEQNFANLYNAIDDACETGSTQVMNFNMPQEFGFQGWLYQTVSEKGDPYFYVYWENFPNQYEGIPVMATWSEDLPWSGNLLQTLALDTIFLGLSPAAGKISTYVSKYLKVPEIIKGTYSSWKNALEPGFKKSAIEAIEKTGKFVVQAGKVAIKDAKYIVPEMAAATMICMATTDLNLGQCVTISVIVAPVLHMTVRYGIPKMISKGVEHIKTMGIVEKFDTVSRIYEETADEGLDSVYYDLQTQGKIGADGLIKDDQWKEALDLLEKDTGQKGLSSMIKYEDGKHWFDPRGWKDSIMEQIKKPWYKLEEFIAEHFSKSTVITPQGKQMLANYLDVLDDSTKDQIFNQMRKNGFSVGKNSEEFFKSLTGTLRDEANAGSILLLPKDSGLATLLQEAYPPEALAKYTTEYLPKMSAQEAKYLYGAYRGIAYRVGEVYKESVDPFIGYTLLRVQDMYTPLGVTYLDREASFYSSTQCGTEELCLQMGWYVRKLPLPDSCVEKDVTQIKLSRSSVVASNPRFYLVSPCFSRLTIWKQDDTVFVKPEIYNTPQGFEHLKDMNYCYATGTMVNTYITMEATAFGVRIGTAIAGIFIPGLSLAGEVIGMIIDVAKEGIFTYPYIPDNLQEMI